MHNRFPMRLYLFIIFSLFNCLLSAQNEIISDKNYVELQNKLRLLTASNIDSALTVARIIEKSESKTHQSFALAAKGFLLTQKKQFKEADSCFKIALKYIEEESNLHQKNQTKAYIYNYIGGAEWFKNDFKKALYYYLQGEKLSKKVKDQIQLIKFNNNIALLNGEIENYQEAIKRFKKSDQLIEANKKLYEIEQYFLNKSNTYMNLGRFYISLSKIETKNQKKYLDSATIAYKKTLRFSENFVINQIRAQYNLGVIYFTQKDYRNAEKIFLNISKMAKEKEMDDDYATSLFSLGSLYYKQNQFDKSLLFLEKVDSIYTKNKSNQIDYINSNYIKSKIYDLNGNSDLAFKYADRYLQLYEQNQTQMNTQKKDINLLLNQQETQREMLLVKEKYDSRIFLKKISIGIAILFFFLVIVLYIKKISEKKRIEQKFNDFIHQYETEKKVTEFDEIPKSTALNIDEEKENEIIKNLEKIIQKEQFLNQDFTLQFVAKKIKTNTTYLSYTVNKNYGKSFSEYINELKINYAINRLLNDKQYRKYSTQAIAESVGFKNATSFTRSFSKRTGLSPVQFIQKIEN